MMDFTGSFGDFDREVSYTRIGVGGTSLGDVSFTQRPKSANGHDLGSTAEAGFETESGSESHRIKGLTSPTAEGIRVERAETSGPVVGMERLPGLASAREALLRKKHSPVGLSNYEKQELEYLTWQIDRIEHARLSGDLSDLEKLADLHEEFAQQVKTLKDSVTEVLSQGRDRH